MFLILMAMDGRITMTMMTITTVGAMTSKKTATPTPWTTAQPLVTSTRTGYATTWTMTMTEMDSGTR